ncbi:hypothetical protein TD95_003746 [Thielaviopsis punctulata]|uniref:DNA mismatch repair protein S5 domain-containing protein n=1 Tax=Thielaviopsis punctulata TaxID=72032 RepID=A0A0F4ZJ62_9PEZI|nr:hypothetical protein TD95_003746 [Thielaviopsis punctulata]
MDATSKSGLNEAQPKRIKALDPNVVNKIAAGEIIIAPVNALKEIIENAVDAGSTSLEVLVKEGGLKLLQVSDNGSGIDLTDFEDLNSITTYGFRGEALSSISQVAHLTVITKTRDSPVAWQAVYQNAKLAPAKPGQSAEPKPVAGRPGTTIKVEDMFYNVPTRRRAFRSPAEEYNKILDMVYGSSVSEELIQFNSAEARWGYQASGYATNANYSHKKTTLLLFINHRCVESTAIRKALEQTYAPYLPKGGHPFIYLSLEIDPARVDVNVHPTKREVHFLNEDEIVQSICDAISAKLSEHDKSRNFMTQTLLPGVSAPASSKSRNDDENTSTSTPGPSTKRRRYSNSLVRTDNSARKITTMFTTSQIQPDASALNDDDTPMAEAGENAEVPEYMVNEREPTKCSLRSVKELRAEVRGGMSNELTEILGNLTFVGVVDETKRLAAIQSGVRLFLIDYGLASYEFFYQIGLTDFGNFGIIRFKPPLDLRATMRIAAEAEASNATAGDEFDADLLVDKVASQLIERREMLLEYFSLEITPTGELVSVPLLIKGYTPPLSKLSYFLLRLGPGVNWTEEKPCFETFLRELAMYYAPEQLPQYPHDKEALAREEIDAEVAERRNHVRTALEHVLFPAFKARLVATRAMERQGGLDVDDLLELDPNTEAFFHAPLLGPLLVTNESSDARDHCANERTFLSYLKLSMYTTVVSVAIVLSFHLKSEPSELELKIATPLGAIFWALSFSVLLVGLANYIGMDAPPYHLCLQNLSLPSKTRTEAPLSIFTVLQKARETLTASQDTCNKYARKAAIVQTGWKTQIVIGMVSVSIMATCVVLLVIGSISNREDKLSSLLAMLED